MSTLSTYGYTSYWQLGTVKSILPHAHMIHVFSIFFSNLSGCFLCSFCIIISFVTIQVPVTFLIFTSLLISFTQWSFYCAYSYNSEKFVKFVLSHILCFLSVIDRLFLNSVLLFVLWTLQLNCKVRFIQDIGLDHIAILVKMCKLWYKYNSILEYGHYKNKSRSCLIVSPISNRHHDQLNESISN